LLESFAEGEHAAVADSFGDRRQGKPAADHELLRFCDPVLHLVLVGRDAEFHLEQPGEMIDAQAGHFRQILQPDGLAIMLHDVRHGLIESMLMTDKAGIGVRGHALKDQMQDF
jgi:hypothetical protein